MTTSNLFIIMLMIAIFGGMIGYAIGIGVANARNENDYYLVEKPDDTGESS